MGLDRSTQTALLDLYGVYTLLFGTKENAFSLGLTDELRTRFNERLNTATQRHTASEPIDAHKILVVRRLYCRLPVIVEQLH